MGIIFLGLSSLGAMDMKPTPYLSRLANRKTICKSILGSPAGAVLFESDLDQLVSCIQNLATTSGEENPCPDDLDAFITERFCAYFKILKGTVTLPQAKELHLRLSEVAFLSPDPQNFNEMAFNVTEQLIQWLGSKEIYFASVMIVLEVFVGLITKKGQEVTDLKMIRLVAGRMMILLNTILPNDQRVMTDDLSYSTMAGRAYDAYKKIFLRDCEAL
jgi:hypothetical protein